MYFQRTIRAPIEVDGIGIHSGAPTTLTFRPAPADHGVHFVRRDLPGTPSIPISVEHIQSTSYATTLGGDDFSVATVEHCLSAVAALRIDNLIIELTGPEMPIGDGSASLFWEALNSVGWVDQEVPRKYLYVTKPILFEQGDKKASVVPYNGLRVTCTIDFAHPRIGEQTIDLDVNPTSFGRELARARTFGFLKEVEMLQSRGLAKGGSLQNAIVLNDEGVINPEGLRYPDEFVRHKAMDALGDLVTLGHPMMGHLTLYKFGHDLTSRFVNKVLQSTDCFKIIELGGSMDREQVGHWAWMETSKTQYDS